MKRLHPALCACAVACLVALSGVRGSAAAMIVIANRSPGNVSFTVAQKGGQAREIELAPGDLVPITAAGVAEIAFPSAAGRQRYTLDGDAAYYFASDPQKKLDLHRIGLGNEDLLPSTPRRGAADVERTGDKRSESGKAPGVITIPVKILVDEEEPATQKVWEKRLRDRVEAASAIIERHCLVRFKVVAVDTWKTDDKLTDFHDSLREFEQKVDPAPARLAIGFTSQYQLPRGRTHLGGIRGPLHTHLLVREWSQHINEPERLEVLLHELGHFLGAVHSPERNSVMRPVLGDRKARAKSFRIGFDPVNALAMCMVGEQLRTRPTNGLADLPGKTQLELRRVYGVLGQAMPGDTSAAQFQGLLDEANLAPLARGARLVAQAVVRVAERNQQLPAADPLRKPASSRADGDELANLYFREAAAAAGRLPADMAPRAYLIGLAVALDKSDVVRKNALVGPFCRAIESDAERRHRLEVLGAPSARGRLDSLEHFAVSGALACVAGNSIAETAGLVKERSDAQGGSGFSFIDYQADLAGIAFANHVMQSAASGREWAADFRIERFLPDQEELREGLTWDAFTRDYGSLTDERFQKVRRQLIERIGGMPAYRAADPAQAKAR